MHVVLNGWFWDQPHTGSGQYLRGLLAALNALAPDLRLTLVVPHHMRTLDALPPHVDVLPMSTRYRGHLAKVWFEQRAFPQAVARLQADLAHVPYWGPPLRVSVPLICTVLDVIPLLVPEYRTGLGNRLYTSLVAAATRGAAHLLTISEASRRDIVQQIHVPADRISITPLAAGSAFHPDLGREHDRVVRARYGLDDVDDFVLYLGAYAVHKNVKLLLAAYTYVAPVVGPDVPLVLAGHTPAQWGTPRFPDVPAYIEEIGLKESVRWIGPVDEADKPALYRLATVFGFPSRYEGFGLGPLEAMACGTPVVTSNASSLPEVVGDAALTVNPDDERSLAEAIIRALTDRTLRQDMIARGITQAKKFSWERTARETTALYREVLA